MAIYSTRALRRMPIIKRTASASLPLDGLASPPRAAYSIRRRLLTSYTGPLIRVRKTTGGDTATEHDVPYVAATGLLDTADRAAFVGSESWVIVTVYDQSSGARHVTNATAANQPPGGVAGVGATLSGFPAADPDGVSDFWARADALGLSGAVALTYWADISFDTLTASASPISVGTFGAGSSFDIRMNTSLSYRVGTPGSIRVFTASLLTAGRQRLIARIGAGAQIGTVRLMQNGVELPEESTINPTTTISLVNGATSLAALHAAAGFLDGRFAECAVWNADLSAGDLAIINGLS